MMRIFPLEAEVLAPTDSYHLVLSPLESIYPKAELLTGT